MADPLDTTPLDEQHLNQIEAKLEGIPTTDWTPLGGDQARERTLNVVNEAIEMARQWSQECDRQPDVDFVNRKIRDVADQKFGVGGATSSQVTRDAQNLFVEAARDVTGVTGSLGR